EIFTDWLVKMGPSTGIILAIIGLVCNFKKYWKEKLIIFAWFIVPLIIQSEYAKVLTLRYILYTIPFFIILISISILQAKSLTKKTIIFILFGILIIQALVFDKNLVTKPEIANLPSSERSGYLEEWSA